MCMYNKIRKNHLLSEAAFSMQSCTTELCILHAVAFYAYWLVEMKILVGLHFLKSPEFTPGPSKY